MIKCEIILSNLIKHYYYYLGRVEVINYGKQLEKLYATSFVPTHLM